MAEVTLSDIRALKQDIFGSIPAILDKALSKAEDNKSNAKTTSVIDKFSTAVGGIFSQSKTAASDREQYRQTVNTVIVDMSDAAARTFWKNRPKEEGITGTDAEESEESSWWKKLLGFLSPLIAAAFAGAAVIASFFLDGTGQGIAQLVGKALTAPKLYEWLSKLPGAMGNFIGKIFSTTFDELFTALSRLPIVATKIIPAITNLFPKLAGYGAQIFTTGALAGLKGVPIIGPLISWAFAIDDYRKGDILGGTINLAAGVAAMFPGVGTALSIGLSVLNLILDLKMGEEGKKDFGRQHRGALAALGKVALSIGTKILKTVKILPVIGSLVDFGFAISRFKQGDFVGGMIDMAAGIAGLAPGVGTVVSIGLSLLNEVLDNTGGGQKTKEFLGGAGTGLFKMVLSQGLKYGAKLLKVLKFVPIIGGVISIGFSIYRFKQGQYVRGLLELVSGILDFIPGAGNLASAAIDGILLVADLMLAKQDKKAAEAGTNTFSWSALGGALWDFVSMSPAIFPFRMLWEGFKALQAGSLKEGFVKFAYGMPFFGTIAGLFGLPDTPEGYMEETQGIDLESVGMEIPVIRELIIGAKGIGKLFKGDLSGLGDIAFMIPGIKPVWDLLNTVVDKGRETIGQQGTAANTIAVAMGRKVLGWVPRGFKGIVGRAMAATMGIPYDQLTSEPGIVAEELGGDASHILTEANKNIEQGGKEIKEISERIKNTGENFTKGSPYADELLIKGGKEISERVQKLTASAKVTTGDLFDEVVKSYANLVGDAAKVFDARPVGNIKIDLISIAEEQLKVQKSFSSDLRKLVAHMTGQTTLRQQFVTQETPEDSELKELQLEMHRRQLNRRDEQIDEKSAESSFVDEAARNPLFALPRALVKAIMPKLQIDTEALVPALTLSMTNINKPVVSALTDPNAPIVRTLGNIEAKLDGANPVVNNNAVLMPGGGGQVTTRNGAISRSAGGSQRDQNR